MTIKPTKYELIFNPIIFTILCVLAGGISFAGVLGYSLGFILYKIFIKPKLALTTGKVLGRLSPPK